MIQADKLLIQENAETILIFDLHTEESATLPKKISTTIEAVLPLPSQIPTPVDTARGATSARQTRLAAGNGRQ